MRRHRGRLRPRPRHQLAGLDRGQRESGLDPRTAQSAHDELEVLAVALDSAVTGGEDELYFRPKAGPD
jgi:hypothetical protein